MARSAYIYVAVRRNLLGPGGYPVAAFTVKHELKSWLEKQASPEWLAFYRLRDGRSNPQAEVITLKEPTDG